ncbi:unnamed protein product [Eruca vesicaria subsp. sativa]|uniref:DUF1985 domain-containing protein n=1 Tax=Eruca vesicaria subsp. sativa TaxID=29727 RepID=A0ABC8M248_ERUVS|nr:unnamed protein product [Eruca vesicaria subsp. sativa]
MASSSGMRKYPPRLYEVGKTLIQGRSMNHSCFLANLQTIKEAVGEEVWSELRESAIGVIVKLKEMEYIWSAKAVHYFLANQLAIDSRHETWSLIDVMPLRFSLYEFGEIIGLNCDPFDKHDVWDVDHREFWLEMKVPTLYGPTLKELQKLVFDDRSDQRIPRADTAGSEGRGLHEAYRGSSPRLGEAFQRYPWGRIGFSSLIDSIKTITFHGKKSYTIHGCVHALLIWVYEFVPGIGEQYGNRIEGAEVPLLSWDGSRTRINFPDFCAHEKDSIRRYPKWVNHEVDTELDNLIKDILDGQLNEQFWNVTPTTKFPEKRKFGVASSDIPNVSPTKRHKGKEPDQGGEAFDMVAAHNVAILGLVESLTKLTEKIEGMDVSVVEKVSKTLEGTIQDKVDAAVGSTKNELLKKIASLEEDADVTIPQGVADSNSGNCKAYGDDDDASSNDLSWKLEKKISSLDGLRIQCVVKKEKKEKKTMEKEEVKTKEVPLKKVKIEKKDEVLKNEVKPEKNDEEPLKK